ncbi:hypothetical protein B0T26DRAFT_344293 [Lasiosphaeria miniovina]|uniref:Uncharacterized protein n=1 Tax=Lasiosphaeria miniovina TaxID=1954250 RepID=A0AA40AB97_9PEZI|nr:uncharacterized protein B0T26DRAFT_344293 [Lasiosphaeria miniovina]KAK0712737.1 hypothetical protein B0T26DRAFT_344293 [Lasiosphaeria miniovina]
MGMTLSRCSSRHARPGSRFSGLDEKILERQPNWLVPPSRWRQSDPDHHPVRYRTPTPYPKEDRRRLGDHIDISEKAAVIEAASHRRDTDTDTLGVQHPAAMHARSPHNHIRFPQLSPAAITITWKQHRPRRNRFERPS